MFVINSLYGTTAIRDEFLTDNSCQWNIISLNLILAGTSDFTDAIDNIIPLDAKVFIIFFESPSMAAILLEQGYY